MQSLRDWAEDHGYTYRCRGCGDICDTSWCGCAAGEPEEPAEDEPLCSWCGDPLGEDPVVTDGDGYPYHEGCADSAHAAEYERRIERTA